MAGDKQDGQLLSCPTGQFPETLEAVAGIEVRRVDLMNRWSDPERLF